jgi:hypothetical protein
MTMTFQLPHTGLHLRETAHGLLERCRSAVIPAKDAAYYAACGKEDASSVTALSRVCACLEPFTDAALLDDPVVATTMKGDDRFQLRYTNDAYLDAFCAACTDVCDHGGKWTYLHRRHANGVDCEVYAHTCE